MGKQNSGKKKQNNHSPMYQMIDRQKPAVILATLFAVGVACRYLLTYLTSAGPTVFIDEGLYVNIARSIARTGMVTYRDQPVEYVYLVYPLTLVPLFYLPVGVNLYRMIQLWNTILMCSSVIPVYLTARKLKIEKPGAYVLCALTLLIPEMAMAGRLTVEALLYPAVMWQVYFFVRALRDEKPVPACVILGILGGISYFIKPLGVVPAGCFLLVMLFSRLMKKDRKGVVASVAGIAGCGALVGLGYLCYTLLFGRVSVMNLYEKQIPTVDGEQILIMVQGFVFHLLAVLFCCGGVYVLVPAMRGKSLVREDRELVIGTGVTLAVLSVSIAVLIVPYKFTGGFGISSVHTRYLMEFAPLLLTLLLIPGVETYRPRKAGVIFLGILTLFMIWPGPFNMFSHRAGTFDSPALNAFCTERIGRIPGILTLAVCVIMAVFVLMRLRKSGWDQKLRRIVPGFVAVFFVINGVCEYANMHAIDSGFEAESQETAEMVADKKVLIVGNNLYDDFRGYQLDAHLYCPAKHVVFNNVILDAVDNGGVYRSFVPLTQSPNTENLPTGEADYLLFDVTTADYVEFVPGLETWTSAQGDYTLVRLKEGEPYLKTALTSMDAYTLHGGENASLIVFDPEILAKGEVTLYVRAQSATGADVPVTFMAGGQSRTATITANSVTLEVTMPINGTDFGLFDMTPSGDIIVIGYRTE